MLYIPDEVLDVVLKNGRKASWAGTLNQYANERLQNACEDYNNMVERTLDTLDDLNSRKTKIMLNQFDDFIDSFQKIKNVSLSEVQGFTDLKCLQTSMPDFKAMKNDVIQVYEYIISGMKTYAIGGAFGIAGILVGSYVMGKKAQTAMNNALANNAAADIQIEKMETAKMEVDAIRELAKLQDKTIRKLSKIAKPLLEHFHEIVEANQDWNQYSLEDKQSVTATIGIMKVLKEIIDQPILDEDGHLVDKTKKQLESSDLKKLGVILEG